MSQYAELVKALRWCADESICCDDFSGEKCPHYAVRGDDCNMDAVLHDAAAAIEALEAQLPKRGEWIEENRRPRSSQFVCSECHRTAYDPQPTRDKAWRKRCRYAYCPNCGAKMREVQDGV